MTVEVSTNKIPDRLPNQDEVLVLIALRRDDPENPMGDANSDVPAFSPDTPFVSAVTLFCEAQGFDPTQTYMSVVGVTDVEQGGAITIADLQALIAANTPSEPDSEQG